MLVRFLTSVAAQPKCYTAGEEVDFPTVEAQAWLKSGHAVPARKAPEIALQDEKRVERAVTRKRR